MLQILSSTKRQISTASVSFKDKNQHKQNPSHTQRHKTTTRTSTSSALKGEDTLHRGVGSNPNYTIRRPHDKQKGTDGNGQLRGIHLKIVKSAQTDRSYGKKTAVIPNSSVSPWHNANRYMITNENIIIITQS